MTSNRDADWGISSRGNLWRGGNGTVLVVGKTRDGRVWARVGDDLLDGEYDSLREAKAAADSEARKS